MPTPHTTQQYEAIIAECVQLFEAKTQDYGTAWRILRLPSITDQIYIKAQRIRSIEDKGTQQINEPIRNEFVGIINYCFIALMQLELPPDASTHLPTQQVMQHYHAHAHATQQLMLAKNHDYGEAWRTMRTSSFTDLILMKLLRIKQIEDNNGSTQVSENVAAGYQDIINYSVFALIMHG
jgi:hypothetical protein